MPSTLSEPLPVKRPSDDGPPNWRFVPRDCCATCRNYLEDNYRWGCRLLVDWRQHDQAHDKAAACFMICDYYVLSEWAGKNG